jgi:V8-like Glu-specific endopeptidase
MKINLLKNTSILVLVGIIISNNGCTIMKRKYLNGYYIAQSNNKKSINLNKHIQNNQIPTDKKKSLFTHNTSMSENISMPYSNTFIYQDTVLSNKFVLKHLQHQNEINKILTCKNKFLTSNSSPLQNFSYDHLFQIIKKRKLQDILKLEKNIISPQKDRDKDRIEKIWSDCGLNFKTALKMVTIFGLIGAHYWYAKKYTIGCLNTFVFIGTLFGIMAIFISPPAAGILLGFYGVINVIWWQIDIHRVKDGTFKPDCYTSYEESRPYIAPKIKLTPIIISGSKADGTLKVGYDIPTEVIPSTQYDDYTNQVYITYQEKPIDWNKYELDQSELRSKVMEYCSNWGYKGYNFFESSKKECLDYRNGVCYKYRFIHECQCTDTPNNSNNSESNNNSSTVKKEIKGTGTAFLISSDGYLITNYHVIEDVTNFNNITIFDTQKRTSYKAKLIANDIRNDLALLKIEDEKFDTKTTVPYTISAQSPRPGDDVFVVGYPEANVLGIEPKFVDGKISALSGFQDDLSSYQLTTPVYPGNSGSPLFNKDGEIVGVINAKFKKGDNVSYAIKKSALINLLETQSINLPNTNLLKNKPIQDKIDAIKKCVYLVVIQ